MLPETSPIGEWRLDWSSFFEDFFEVQPPIIRKAILEEVAWSGEQWKEFGPMLYCPGFASARPQRHQVMRCAPEQILP